LGGVFMFLSCTGKGWLNGDYQESKRFLTGFRYT
jgi:hypothetical protein